MVRIDAHQHFWKYDPVRDHWITDDMRVLQQDFRPEDLKPLLDAHHMDGCIVVQSSQEPQENMFQLELAAAYDFVKAVVGWVDLRAADIETQLEAFTLQPKLRGFRHMLQGEEDRALMLTPAFRRGLRALQRYGYVYDLLILPDQLPYAVELVHDFPELTFVIDHMAKPGIRLQEVREWAKYMRQLGKAGNVYCKVSGLITEASWHSWQPSDFVPYLDTVVEAFGMQRLMYGSDWPVCLLAGSYDSVIGLTEDYFASCSSAERAAFYGGNAIHCYQSEE